VFAQGNRGLSESCGRLLFSAAPAYMNAWRRIKMDTVKE
jgi:hypothetical protein